MLKSHLTSQKQIRPFNYFQPMDSSRGHLPVMQVICCICTPPVNDLRQSTWFHCLSSQVYFILLRLIHHSDNKDCSISCSNFSCLIIKGPHLVIFNSSTIVFYLKIILIFFTQVLLHWTRVGICCNHYFHLSSNMPSLLANEYCCVKHCLGVYKQKIVYPDIEDGRFFLYFSAQW